VIYKYARLSREPATLTATVGMLRTAGVEVEPVTDQKLGTGKLDDMMLYIMSSFGKIQVQDSTEHAKAARKALHDKGKLVCSGRARYGYRYDTEARTRVVDEPAAAVVRKIYGWYCEGTPPTPSSCCWSRRESPAPRASPAGP
jgi:DNA invertase Pin-like site-specific DNA recombinase